MIRQILSVLVILAAANPLVLSGMLGARQAVNFVTLLAMAAVTAFVCVFLLFKVRTIEVTGDQVYDPSAILELCGYQEGDNLALLTTGEQEAALEEQLPYVEDAQILRHFPSGLEIHITAAQQAACVQSGSQWFIISGKGKILEEAPPADLFGHPQNARLQDFLSKVL